jgi:hypothetical protein
MQIHDTLNYSPLFIQGLDFVAAITVQSASQPGITSGGEQLGSQCIGTLHSWQKLPRL